MKSTPAATAASRRWFQPSHFWRSSARASASASARASSTAAFTALSTAALICRWRRLSRVSSNQSANTVIVPQISVMARAMAAEAIATGANSCHTERILSGMPVSDSSRTALRISQTAPMIIWSVNKRKYSRLCLTRMLQMDSRTSSARLPGPSYVRSGSSSCSNPFIPGSWSAARWWDR